MKFPSIKSLADSTGNTFRRFPFEVLFALAGTIAATIYINSDDTVPYSFYTKMIMAANLGLLLSLSASLYFESKGLKKQLAIRLVDNRRIRAKKAGIGMAYKLSRPYQV